MAKIYFENRFILTKKLHRQYCSACFKKMRFTTRLISFILAVVSLAVAIYAAIGRLKYITVGALIVFLYFLFMIFFGYMFSEWINYRNMQKEHGQAIVMIVGFSPKQVFVRVNKTSLAFKYETISKAYETKDLIILILSRKGMIEHGQIIYKTGFTNGTTVQEFKKFVNDKSGKEIFEDTN